MAHSRAGFCDWMVDSRGSIRLPHVCFTILFNASSHRLSKKILDSLRSGGLFPSSLYPTWRRKRPGRTSEEWFWKRCVHRNGNKVSGRKLNIDKEENTPSTPSSEGEHTLLWCYAVDWYMHLPAFIYHRPNPSAAILDIRKEFKSN